ncbi:hypothetical protein T09_5919 [Trichinella sp. T9]|nr:hypothetical protein T09_5919 [Trichinella sp. T9]
MGRARRITTPNHHTTCYPTLTSLFFLPVDLQKAERDTQSCMYPRIWSLGEYIRVQRNDRCRRAKNPKDIERRHSETVGLPEKTEANHQSRSRRSTCVQESYVRLCLSLQSTVNSLTTERLLNCQIKEAHRLLRSVEPTIGRALPCVRRTPGRIGVGPGRGRASVRDRRLGKASMALQKLEIPSARNN